MAYDNTQQEYQIATAASFGTDEIEAFVCGRREFLAVHRPSGSLDILRINGYPTDRMIRREMGKVRMSYCGRLAEDEHKLIRMLDLWIAENNYSGSKQNLRTDAALPLSGIMEMLGKKSRM